MVSTNNSDEYIGVLKFNEQTKQCYIQTEDGTRYNTTPLFEFMNGFIGFELFMKRIRDYYEHKDVKYITEKMGEWQDDLITPQELYKTLQERYGF